MVSCILLCALTLTSTADTEGRSPQIQTALGIPNTTFSDRQSRPSPTPTYVNTMATKQDAKSAKPQRSVDALHSSEGRFTAKSPLVLRLLQEQESTDISSQLVHLPVPQLHPGTEEEAVYYQEAPHENTGGVQENAGPEKETFTNKVIRVTCFVSASCLRQSLSSHFRPSMVTVRGQSSSVSIALGYGLNDRGFKSRHGLGIFLFDTVYTPALGHNQPPIQWVSGDLSLG
jgi:hypothetical protein